MQKDLANGSFVGLSKRLKGKESGQIFGFSSLARSGSKDK